jgi:hypothetical protein
MGEEALRDHKMEIVPGARHCYIKKAPLLLDLGRAAGAEVRRDAVGRIASVTWLGGLHRQYVRMA